MKKFILMLSLALMLTCLFVVSVSAEITTYDDAPEKTKIQVSKDDVVLFDDGFCCPTGYVFKDRSDVYGGGYNNPTLDDANVFDFSYIYEKTGKNYTFSNIVELDLPQGITSIGQYAATGLKNLRRVTIPDSVTSLGNCIFQSATGLQECEFEHTESSSLTKFPNFMFYETALTAFSMPDCITTVEGQAQFAKCSKLTAVHLSNNITTWSSGSQSNASFYNCTNMYFVNQAFTYASVPQKPEVYYFPSNLESISGETFKTCTSLNNVLVFGEKLTNINHDNAPWVFNGCGGTSTIVFLGDMENIKVGRNGGEFIWNVKGIYFANANDKSYADAGYVGKQDGNKIFFCNAEGNTSHIAEKSVLVNGATCTDNEFSKFVCFCGADMGVNEVEGTALGHNHTIPVGAIYDSYLADGYTGNKCERCEDVAKEVLGALFTYHGYSCTEKAINGSHSVAQFFGVNNENVAKYEELTGKTVNFGIVATGNADGTAIKPLEKGDKVITQQFSDYPFGENSINYFAVKVNGIASSYVETNFIFCAYISVDGEVVYLDNNAQVTELAGISHSQLNSILN